MLIACGDCHRQYDVGRREPGTRLRCSCGALMEVPREAPRTARVVHCESCGGTLEEGASRCGYCGSQITASDRRFGPACPECLARLGAGARFCVECGVEIRPEVIRTTTLESRCPRCEEAKLLLRAVEGGSFTECSGCGGIWLEQETFERLLDRRRDDPGLAAHFRSRGAQQKERPATSHPVRYLSCPSCSQRMHRKNFAGRSGIILDICADHGVWFDAFELEKILKFVAGGGLEEARRLEAERLERQINRQRAEVRPAAPYAMPAPGGSHPDNLHGGFDIFDVLGEIVGSFFRR
ncbi:MAG: zf-TFIIB domain-containing protein [Planctomycetota bacterium]